MRLDRTLPLVGILIVSAACSETNALLTATAPAVTPDATPRRYVVEEGPQDPPPDVPPEQQTYTELTVEAGAGFIGNTAYGEAIIRYNGTDATGKVHIDVTRGATSYGSADGRKEQSDFLPADRSFAATTTRLLPGSCGFIVNTLAEGSVLNKAINIANYSLMVWGQKAGSDTKGAEAPRCSPPKARARASYGGVAGQTIDLTIPQGQAIVVGLDASGSTPGESGGAAITSYAWQLGGASLGGNDASTSLNMSSSNSFSVTVTDEVGGSGNATGAVNIAYLDPCDDPATKPTEECDNSTAGPETAVGPEVGLGGDFVDFGNYHGFSYDEKVVCMVTDWFEWDMWAEQWRYVNTKIEYCWIEW